MRGSAVQKEVKASDCGEAHTIDGDPLAPMYQGDVLPALHLRNQCIGGLRIIGVQEVKSAFGEDYAKAPGGIGSVCSKRTTSELG